MDPSLQRVLLLVLGALVPVVAYVATRADLIAAVAAVNVLLIWLSLSVATGGTDRFDPSGIPSTTEEDGSDR